jgi:uncharacterized membrane protein HdeD (DUF308 family)
MQEQARAALSGGVPWKKGIGWPIVAIEGGALLGVGVYMLADPDGARDIVRQLIAALLLINGVLEILAGFRLSTDAAAPFRFIRGSVGATVGAIITLEPISDYLDEDASRIMLAIGLTAYGLIGLAGTIAGREERGIRIGALATAALSLIFAIILFTGDESDSSRMDILGVMGIVFGALLLLYAFYLYRAKTLGAVPASAPPA